MVVSSDPYYFLLSNSQYTLHRKDRINGYDGATVFVRNVLSIVRIDVLNDLSTIECLVLSSDTVAITLFVCIIHLPWLIALIIHI